MDLYGPPLPPGYVKPDDSDSDDSSSGSSEKQTPVAPKIIGPQVPDFLSRKELGDLEASSSSEVIKNEPSNIIGPALPASLKRKSYGDSSDEESYGPVASLCSNGKSDINETRAAIEKRSADMKNKLDNKYLPTVDAVEREEWMTVPAEGKNQLGALSRSLAPESKSSSSKEKHSHRRSEKDHKTTEELKKYNKSKRSESLMDMHKKDKKKKDKEKKDKKERKAFDRDEIAVKQFNKDQVSSMVDKAKYLNSRFGRGNEQYL